MGRGAGPINKEKPGLDKSKTNYRTNVNNLRKKYENKGQLSLTTSLTNPRDACETKLV